MYFEMLQSGDITIVKEGVQLFSDAFAQKRHILGSYRKIFCDYLEKLLVMPEYISIRKWILKCACYYSTPAIEKICENDFYIIEDSETQNWMISTIASRYTDVTAFSAVINAMRKKAYNIEQEMMLDRKNIFYNASIFGKFPMNCEITNIEDEIFRENDRNGKFWLSKLAAYPEIAQRRNLQYLVKEEDMERMSYSDDEEVQVYAYWAMVHHSGGSLKLSEEERKDKCRTKSALKWYYAGIIPGEYRNCNLDYITDILMTVNTKYVDDLRAKEGILNGLKKIPYNSCFDDLIIDWFYSENFQKIRIKILEYMIKNVKKNADNEKKYSGNGSFFEIVSDECQDMSNIEYIKRYINLYKTLEYKINDEEIQLSYKKEKNKMSEFFLPNAIFNAPVNVGDNGTINMQSENVVYEKILIATLKEFIEKCEDDKLVTESKDILKKYNMNEEDWKSKILSLNSHLADFVTVLTAAPQVIFLAQKIMEYIGYICK